MIKEKIKLIALWIWEQLRIPLIIFGLFWIAGYGFYSGIIGAEQTKAILTGKAIVVTAIDLRKDDE